MPHVDWDASRRERRAKRQPTTMAVFGETITLPPGLPAGVALDLMEIEDQEGEDADLADLDPAVLVEMLYQVFGEHRVETWRREPSITIDDLADLLFAAMDLMSPDNGEGESGEDQSGSGSGPAPSSTDGRRSKPTSPPSTRSTSRTRTRSRV